MEDAELLRVLTALDGRLEVMAARLAALERIAGEATELRARLEHEIASRLALAEQTAWLIEVLGEARKQVRWLETERTRLMGDSGV